MSDHNKAFREYATRVSFNMTLSRNQIYAMRCVLVDIHLATPANQERRWQTHIELTREHKALGGVDNYIGGARALARMGLIESDPRWVAEMARQEAAKAAGDQPGWKYHGPSWRMTPAGEHVVALLQIAGLIAVPKAAANTNRRERRRA